VVPGGEATPQIAAFGGWPTLTQCLDHIRFENVTGILQAFLGIQLSAYNCFAETVRATFGMMPSCDGTRFQKTT
jgi:hypothetical protein